MNDFKKLGDRLAQEAIDVIKLELNEKFGIRISSNDFEEVVDIYDRITA